jgi:hypothetical protein
MNKIGLMGIIFFTATVSNIVEPKAYAPDVYTAIEIPKEFTPSSFGLCLNNKGIVVGTNENKAAYWSEKSGLVVLNEKFYSTGSLINDAGFIVGVVPEENHRLRSNTGRLMAWDININQAKMGPIGTIGTLNDKNDVLFWVPNDANVQHIWNIRENTVEISSLNNINLPEWLPYRHRNLTEGFFNKKLTGIKWIGSDLYMVLEGKNKLLLPNNGTLHGSAWLNDNDEVIAITYVKSTTEKTSYNEPKLIFSITKWRSDAVATKSEPISNDSLLKDYYDIEIKGFNNLGQALILATKRGNSGKTEGQFFLLKLA